MLLHGQSPPQCRCVSHHTILPTHGSRGRLHSKRHRLRIRHSACGLLHVLIFHRSQDEQMGPQKLHGDRPHSVVHGIDVLWLLGGNQRQLCLVAYTVTNTEIFARCQQSSLLRYFFCLCPNIVAQLHPAENFHHGITHRVSYSIL